MLKTNKQGNLLNTRKCRVTRTLRVFINTRIYTIDNSKGTRGITIYVCVISQLLFVMCIFARIALRAFALQVFFYIYFFYATVSM